MSGLFSKETRAEIALRPGELRIVLLAAAYFFVVLAAWFMVRPVREQLGIAGGVWDLRWLFLVTWAVMLLLQPLYGRAVAVFPRRVFVPLVYFVAGGSFLLFFLGMQTLGAGDQLWLGRGFYVWSSVVNLWIVAVFWSYMADHVSSERAKRLYPWIAVGGTLGAIVGGLVAKGTLAIAGDIGGEALADQVVAWLLPASAVLLFLVPWFVARLHRALAQSESALGLQGAAPAAPIGGSAWAGLRELVRSPYMLRISVLALGYSLTSTLLYFAQADIVSAAFDSRAERTEAFAVIDIITQSLTLFVQVFLTRRFISSLGIGRTLAILPVIAAASLLAVWLFPIFGVIAASQALRRASSYAVSKPTREVLFSVLSREDKYKAKAAIDTFVYRTGDALGAMTSMGLRAVAPALAAVVWLGLPITFVWTAVALRLGRDHAERTHETPRGDGDETP